MALVCEDLARYGVVLIPPSTAEYFELLADIEHRLQTRPEGAPPIPEGAISRISEHDTSGSAILVNKADVAIACVAYIWEGTGRFLQTWQPRGGKVEAYWNNIFPGSKRLMMCDGSWFGDNTDVRSPAEDELSRGGGWCSVGAGRRLGRPKPSKLTLDGVFFVDGGFAGPNQLGSWEHTVFAAEANLACAELAREARSKGTTPTEFFAQMQALTGQTDDERMPPRPRPRHLGFAALDPEAIRKFEWQQTGWRVLSMRKSFGDEAALAGAAAWADAPVPKFHKL